MKDFFGLTVKIGDKVVYVYDRKGSSAFIISEITDIIGNKVKIKGLVKKRESNEIMSYKIYEAFLENNPEYLI